MDVKYLIRSAFIENSYEVEISSDQFNEIKHSRCVLSAALEIEHLFDNLISNYVDVENRCLEQATLNLVRRTCDYREANGVLAQINLGFVNYLTTARAYVDHAASAASRCFKCDKDRTNHKALVKTMLNREYDKEPAYRFMEVLRNHVQHSGSALHTLNPRSVRVAGNTAHCETFVEPLWNKSDPIVKLNREFKKGVLDECPEVVNLLTCARIHLRGLSRVHHIIRSEIEIVTNTAARCIKEGQAKLTGHVSGTLEGSEAVAITHDGDIEETIPMLLKWEDVRQWLIVRNQGAGDGITSYPSSRSSDPILWNTKGLTMPRVTESMDHWKCPFCCEHNRFESAVSGSLGDSSGYVENLLCPKCGATSSVTLKLQFRAKPLTKSK